MGVFGLTTLLADKGYYMHITELRTLILQGSPLGLAVDGGSLLYKLIKESDWRFGGELKKLRAGAAEFLTNVLPHVDAVVVFVDVVASVKKEAELERRHRQRVRMIKGVYEQGADALEGRAVRPVAALNMLIQELRLHEKVTVVATEEEAEDAAARYARQHRFYVVSDDSDALVNSWHAPGVLVLRDMDEKAGRVRLMTESVVADALSLHVSRLKEFASMVMWMEGSGRVAEDMLKAVAMRWCREEGDGQASDLYLLNLAKVLSFTRGVEPAVEALREKGLDGVAAFGMMQAARQIEVNDGGGGGNGGVVVNGRDDECVRKDVCRWALSVIERGYGCGETMGCALSCFNAFGVRPERYDWPSAWEPLKRLRAAVYGVVEPYMPPGRHAATYRETYRSPATEMLTVNVATATPLPRGVVVGGCGVGDVLPWMADLVVGCGEPAREAAHWLQGWPKPWMLPALALLCVSSQEHVGSHLVEALALSMCSQCHGVVPIDERSLHPVDPALTHCYTLYQAALVGLLTLGELTCAGVFPLPEDAALPDGTHVAACGRGWVAVEPGHAGMRMAGLMRVVGVVKKAREKEREKQRVHEYERVRPPPAPVPALQTWMPPPLTHRVPPFSHGAPEHVYDTRSELRVDEWNGYARDERHVRQRKQYDVPSRY